MRFVRPLDWSGEGYDGPRGYKGRLLFAGESCVIIATKVPRGAEGPPMHVHAVDQLYFVTAGEITIQLGGEVRKVAAPGLIFIPAGVAHHNWNEGPDDEVHFEVLAPGIAPGQSPMEFVEDAEDHGLPWFVRTSDPNNVIQYGLFGLEWLLNRAMGATHASLYLSTISPGGAGPLLHTHPFDQFFIVLKGTLTVQIGLERLDVPAGNLVVLPAGVPHRQWNEKPQLAAGAVLLVPEPPQAHTVEEPWDLGVTLAAAEPTQV